ncbi:MAG TPA: hypothetical protein VJW94_08310 [Candidatus Acidoferrum sp.]|nr:hypothetical protein [Candidatus Acidoferrum sp.]
MVRASSFAADSRSSPRIAKGTIIAAANIVAALKVMTVAAGEAILALVTLLDAPGPSLG